VAQSVYVMSMVLDLTEEFKEIILEKIFPFLQKIIRLKFLNIKKFLNVKI